MSPAPIIQPRLAPAPAPQRVSLALKPAIVKTSAAPKLTLSLARAVATAPAPAPVAIAPKIEVSPVHAPAPAPAPTFSIAPKIIISPAHAPAPAPKLSIAPKIMISPAPAPKITIQSAPAHHQVSISPKIVISPAPAPAPVIRPTFQLKVTSIAPPPPPPPPPPPVTTMAAAARYPRASRAMSRTDRDHVTSAHETDEHVRRKKGRPKGSLNKKGKKGPVRNVYSTPRAKPKPTSVEELEQMPAHANHNRAIARLKKRVMTGVISRAFIAEDGSETTDHLFPAPESTVRMIVRDLVLGCIIDDIKPAPVTFNYDKRFNEMLRIHINASVNGIEKCKRIIDYGFRKIKRRLSISPMDHVVETIAAASGYNSSLERIAIDPTAPAPVPRVEDDDPSYYLLATFYAEEECTDKKTYRVRQRYEQLFMAVSMISIMPNVQFDLGHDMVADSGYVAPVHPLVNGAEDEYRQETDETCEEILRIYAALKKEECIQNMIDTIIGACYVIFGYFKTS